MVIQVKIHAIKKSENSIVQYRLQTQIIKLNLPSINCESKKDCNLNKEKKIIQERAKVGNDEMGGLQIKKTRDVTNFKNTVKPPAIATLDVSNRADTTASMND